MTSRETYQLFKSGVALYRVANSLLPSYSLFSHSLSYSFLPFKCVQSMYLLLFYYLLEIHGVVQKLRLGITLLQALLSSTDLSS